MRAFAAVFTREVFERRFAFVVAFAAGFVPLIGSLAYGWRSPDAAEGRVLVALVGATALSAAFAILLGASVIVGDTREKRISFYFSRPVPSGALWAGKLLAAIVITLATAFLAFAPGWLSGPGRMRGIWGFNPGPGETLLGALALALAVLLVLGSHAVVTFGRLRSPWVALDLILGPALVFLAAVFLRSLARDSLAGYYGSDGVNLVEVAVIVLAAAFIVALVLATFFQVAEGRTDARRAHGAFSVVLFGVSGAAVVLVGGYAWWCAAAKATDLVSVLGGVQTAPRGPWLAAGGSLRAGRGSGSFLFDTVGGPSLRLHGWNVAFSQDGTRAAWGEQRFGFFERKDNRSDVFVADLASGRVVATGLECAGSWSDLALSPDGRRLAARDGRTIAAYDISDTSNPRQLAVFQVESGVRSFAFVDADTLRLFPSVINARNQGPAGAWLEITELSAPSKKSLVTGRFNPETLPYLRLTPDARFFVGTRRLTDDAYGKQAITLHDGRTGALVATLAEDLRSPQLRFMADGRMVVAGIAGLRAGLLTFESEKAPPRALDLGPAASILLGGEIAPGRVAVALNPFQRNDAASRPAWKLAFVDVATGAVSPGPAGLVPANRFGWWFSPVMPPAEAGSPASSLFLDAEDRLVRLDPATGAKTVLLGKGK
jgi:hypothetical protein